MSTILNLPDASWSLPIVCIAAAMFWLGRHGTRLARWCTGVGAAAARPKLKIDPKLLQLTEEELRSALLVGDDNPLWRAMHQCIGIMREKAVREAIDIDCQKHAALINFYAGAAAHLDELAQFLYEQRELARTIHPAGATR